MNIIKLEVNNILILYYSNKIKDYKINSIVTDNDKLTILINLLDYTNYSMYYYNLFKFIIININKLYKETNDKNLLINTIRTSNLLNKLTCVFKGHYLLNKLNKNFYKDIDHTIIISLILLASKQGVYLTFLFWLNKLIVSPEELNNYLYKEILKYSIINKDIRICKYILNKLDTDIYIKDTSLVINIIKSLKYVSDNKFIIKRLKLLYQYINLNIYFNLMISSFTSIKILILIHKYYYKTPHTFLSLYNLFNSIILNNSLILDSSSNNFINLISNIYKLIELFNSPTEKILTYIILDLKYNIYFRINVNKTILTEIVVNNQFNIINMILAYTYKDYINRSFFNFINNIFKIIVNKNLLTYYFQNIQINFIDTFFLLHTKYLVVNENNKIYCNTIIQANKILFYLRIFMKTYHQKKIILYCSKKYDINREIRFRYMNNHCHQKVENHY